MRRFILIDLDDTVAASWRREHLIQESWDAFHADLINDEPIFDIVRLLQSLQTNNDVPQDDIRYLRVVALTARPEKWRTATVEWLTRHGVPFDELIMRPDDNFRPSREVKVSMAIERFGSEDAVRQSVAFVIDDREDVCQAFAGLGVTTLQIYARRQP